MQRMGDDARSIVAHVESDATAVVQGGLPVFSDGVTKLGSIDLHCDGSIEGQVWGAGAALGRVLLNEGFPEELHEDRPTVVEVGSGTGVAGLAAAIAGASRVVLTDFAAVVPKLWASIRLNEAVLEGCEVSAAPLEWGDEDAADTACDGGCDLVLACDCLYSGEAHVHAALRATLVALARPRDALICYVYEERWPAVTALWRTGLEQSDELRLIREAELEAPPCLGGRRVLLQVIRVVDDFT